MSNVNWQFLEGLLESMTPAEKLELIERVARSLHTPGPGTISQQLQAIADLREQLAKLPLRNPDDGFSSSDHDEALYGTYS